MHSGVGEFEVDKILALLRPREGEIQKGSGYTPEQQCLMERGWRTIKNMASTMIVTTALSEAYWEYAEVYANPFYG